MKSVIHIGLDVHKDSISIALAEGGSTNEARYYQKMVNCTAALDRLIVRLRKKHPDSELEFAYEAGPCGFVIARHLIKRGYKCVIFAPSKLPRAKGEKIKTDRRDAVMIARALRAGDLRPVHIPNEVDQAIRDLCRARTDAVGELRRAKQRLKAFLLVHGIRYQGKANWGPRHMAYLRELSLPHPAMRVVLEESIMTIDEATARVGRCEQAMESLLEDWQLKPAVEAVMAFRGFKLVAAMLVVSELGNITRFASARQLMGFLGLVPTEDTSSTRRRLGAITKCGNSHVRWLLIEVVRHYRLTPKVSRELTARQQGVSTKVKTISWKTQLRLHGKIKRLVARHVPYNKAIVAAARELSGFLWAMLRDLPCYRQGEEHTAATSPA